MGWKIVGNCKSKLWVACRSCRRRFFLKKITFWPKTRTNKVPKHVFLRFLIDFLMKNKENQSENVEIIACKPVETSIQAPLGWQQIFQRCPLHSKLCPTCASLVASIFRILIFESKFVFEPCATFGIDFRDFDPLVVTFFVDFFLT